jgi:DNA-binding Lrp family transcriptional regulator
MTKKAFVLINTTEGKAKEVSELIKRGNGVVSAGAVTGPYDVIAVVETADFTEMGNIITTRIAHIPDVDRWVVCAEHH